MKRLLLLGGGHAHLEVLRYFAQLAGMAAKVEGVLVSPDPKTPYSGMLPGVVAGHYALAEAQIDLSALAQRAGWRYLAQAVQGLDLAARSALLADGTRIDYDVLSLDTGAVADVERTEGAALHAVALRPFMAFLARWQDMLADAVAGRVRKIAVVGAGAAGVEMALAMATRLAAAGSAAARCRLALLTDADTILAMHAHRVRTAFEQILAQRRIEVHCGAAVLRVEPGAIYTASGEAVEADRTVWATAGAAPAWPKTAGLATDERGFVAVDRMLRSLSHPEVFGGGDIVTLSDRPHPKSGVYAVRHGPILASNLFAALRNTPLRAYAPQRHALSLLSAGERYAVASWNGWSISGNWVWNWKDRIDRAFVAKYGARAP